MQLATTRNADVESIYSIVKYIPVLIFKNEVFGLMSVNLHVWGVL
jgi:hypothetical protein